jgi:hypothetical protein
MPHRTDHSEVSEYVAFVYKMCAAVDIEPLSHPSGACAQAMNRDIRNLKAATCAYRRFMGRPSLRLLTSAVYQLFCWTEWMTTWSLIEQGEVSFARKTRICPSCMSCAARKFRTVLSEELWAITRTNVSRTGSGRNKSARESDCCCEDYPVSNA